MPRVDLVGGTSTGSIIGILLARLGLSIEECEAIYECFPEKLFKGNKAVQFLHALFTGARNSTKGQRKLFGNRSYKIAWPQSKRPNSER